MELQGAVAVVTGGAAGIGRATALALGREGAAVVVGDIDGDGARETAAAIGDAVALTVDVADRVRLENFVHDAIAWKGRCDVFMANVGVGCHGAPHEFGPDQWRYLLDVNLMSAIWPLRTVIPHMLERGSGRLVFVTSGAGYEGHAIHAPYNVAKFGIVGLAESCRAALEGSGVGVTLVVPGAIASDGWKRTVFPDEHDAEQGREEMRQHMSGWASPEMMAELIVDGLRSDRFHVVQENPYEPDWLANVLARKLQRDS